MKINGDEESLSPRLMSPGINFVFQSTIVDLRSAITLGDK